MKSERPKAVHSHPAKHVRMITAANFQFTQLTTDVTDGFNLVFIEKVFYQCDQRLLTLKSSLQIENTSVETFQPRLQIRVR